MTARRRLTVARGLSLIELMLTMTILAVAGGLVAGSFATSLRAWQSGLRSGRSELVARIVLERISAQLRAAVRSPAKRDGEKAVAFDAGEGRLRFVTLAGEGPPIQVSYALRPCADGTCLVYREYPWPDKEFFGESRPRREERLPEVTGFSVEAVKSDEADSGGNLVTKDWSPTDEVLPDLVKVELEVVVGGRAETRRYASKVPLMAQGVP